jgi:predicted PurR-regulated permease PerM
MIIKKSNIIALVLVVLAAFALVLLMNKTIRLVQTGRLDERYEALVAEVDARCEEVDLMVRQDQDWESRHERYVKGISAYVEYLDAHTNAAAEVYDSHFNLVSKRVVAPGDRFIDLLEQEDFIWAMQNAMRGEYTVKGHYPLRMYFRRVPLYTDDYLITVVGMYYDYNQVKLHPYFLRSVYIVFGIAAVSLGILIFMSVYFLREHLRMLKKIKEIWSID